MEEVTDLYIVVRKLFVDADEGRKPRSVLRNGFLTALDPNYGAGQRDAYLNVLRILEEDFGVMPMSKS